MKKIITILLIVIATKHLTAQNLVSNPSFENFTLCPFSTGAVNQAVDWFVAGFSPDYYNSCTSSANTGVPSNICGYQQAATGNAYIGMLCYSSFASSYNPNAREYATGTLTQPLTIGTTYYVSFKVARMNASSHAVDHIGAKFSMSNSQVFISNSAHIFTSSVVTDTLNWTIVQGSFIADSAYQFFTLGNHFDDASTTVVSLQPVTFGHNAYYFVDDVCVSDDPLGCTSEVGINESFHNEDIALFPNPFTYQLNILSNLNENAEIIIYDISSRMFLQQTFSGSFILDTHWLAKGMYLYEIRKASGIVKKGSLVKD